MGKTRARARVRNPDLKASEKERRTKSARKVAANNNNPPVFYFFFGGKEKNKKRGGGEGGRCTIVRINGTAARVLGWEGGGGRGGGVLS